MPEKDARITDQLQQVGRRLKQWRKVHPPRTRLPEEVWAAAVEVAGEEGIYATARALRLDYANLKRRVEEARSRVIAPARGTPITRATGRTRARTRKATVREAGSTDFVELLTGSIGATDCVIELEGGGGRMRIQMKLTTPQVMSLVRDWREDRPKDDNPILTLGKRGDA